MRNAISLMFACIFLTSIHAFSQQTTVSGNVTNQATKENLSAASVLVKETQIGVYTDDKGNFSMRNITLPATLLISSVGFETIELPLDASQTSKLQITMKPTAQLGQEVVVSATRFPERILESPVSIERVNAAAIRTATGANYYDIVATLRGVDVTTSSLTFKTPTTRGFNSSGNTRFNQLVDGMDNQAPGLNFPVASIIGLSELDIDNMELLSGASSALYGSGGMNGTMLMKSKNPFKYQGLSFMVKEGIMHTNARERNASPYHNITARWANVVNDRFAYKMNVELIHAKDWLAEDYRNYARAATGGSVIAGTRQSDPNYDGINVYGDETTAEIRTNVLNSIAAQAPFLKNFIDTLNGGRAMYVSRTGYTENQVINPTTINYKMSGSLHYKITPATEAVLAGYWGTGNTVYTGSERYSLENFKMGQYKLELNNKDWNIRAFTTQENAGNSYNTTVATRLLNEAWKPSAGSTGWYAQYGQSYLTYRLNGFTDAAAHTSARAFADQGRPEYNSDAFRRMYDSIRSKPISEGGALLVDKSDLYSIEGTYNLSNYMAPLADIIVGANYKKYILNSDGTLFADKKDSSIGTYEYGLFAQATRKLTDQLKVSFSGRYDKNQNFDARFTPRATAVYKLADHNNIRFSYQTAYRFPSNQQQWIDLGVGSNVRLLGCNEYFWNKYNLVNNPVYDFEALRAGNLQKFTPSVLKPESISSFELGYKGLLKEGKLMVDMNVYWGTYKNFIGRKIVIQSKTANPAGPNDVINDNIYSLPVNSTDKVTTFGLGLGLDYLLPQNFSIGGNVSSDNLQDVPDNFVAYFNAPQWKANIYIANSGMGNESKVGFRINYRWQQSLFYQGDFATGTLPDIQVLDAQISYRLPKTKSIVKLGANNLLNQYYYDAVGNPRVGGLYYLSYGFNVY